MEQISPAGIDNILDDLLQELDGLLKPGQEINFKNSVEQDVWADRNLIKNILINLVFNAIKFAGEKCCIQLAASFADSDFIIAVEDKGIGISDEDQKHLFERFFRGKNASHIQGTGLGLHIVGKYLELMGGRITMRSKLNEGTTVCIYIPQKKAGHAS
jgi:signal transduction histidine kinase